jgi:hypothetical protein
MPVSRLDHLVIVAASLEQGVAWCEARLGAAPSRGGEHLRMGTHNRLLYLGSSLYLEIIAINPAAGQPEFVRWFGMDDPVLRHRVAVAPELRTFMVATDDIASANAVLPQLGAIEQMRRGDLQWQITVRPDGVLQEGGCLPGLIQWPKGVHPSAGMQDTGCRLVCLEVRHPDPARLAAQWRAIGLQQDDQLVLQTAAAPYLVARVATPNGVIAIGGE